MCGIVGYVGKEQAAPILLDGLRRLEYRGYDSTGIAVCGAGTLRVEKSRGRLQVLSDLTHEGADLPGTVGIGHTRWATHGEPNDINAHPHVSQSGKIAVVHNGIIENYIELKEQLLHKGVHFPLRDRHRGGRPAARLLLYRLRRHLRARWCACSTPLDGSYALGIICADFPDRLLCGAQGRAAAARLRRGRELHRLRRDGDHPPHARHRPTSTTASSPCSRADGIRVYDRQMHPVEKERYHVDWDVDAAEKGGYAHFMLKEIHEQPHAIREAIRRPHSGRPRRAARPEH